MREVRYLIEKKRVFDSVLLQEEFELNFKNSSEGKTGVDLAIDSAVTLLDLEGSLVSPGVVPGVNCEPVVKA
jgi:hypothetical protein